MPFIALEPSGPAPPLSIHYEVWSERAEAPALVLVHELGGTLDSFRAFGKLLAARYRVIAFDQRGAGLSEEPVAPFTVGDLAEDIGRLADALRIQRPFHLMGLAMGAVTNLQFAVRHNEQLASLILCDGTSEIDAGSSDYLRNRAAVVRKEGMRAVADATFKNAFRGLADAATNPVWAAYRQRFLGNSPHGYAMHLEALAGIKLDPASFAKIKCRTLALTGQHDCIWSPAVGESLASKIPDARFEIVENAAHFPPIQDTQRVASRVMQFLDESDVSA